MMRIASLGLCIALAFSGCALGDGNESVISGQPIDTEASGAPAQPLTRLGLCPDRETVDFTSLHDILTQVDAWLQITPGEFSALLERAEPDGSSVVVDVSSLMEAATLLVGDVGDTKVFSMDQYSVDEVQRAANVETIWISARISGSGPDRLSSALIVEHPDGTVEWAGECNVTVTEMLQGYIAAARPGSSEVEVLNDLVTSQAEIDRLWAFTTADDEPVDWYDLGPFDRLLIREQAPAEVFDDLYGVAFVVVIPEWWGEGKGTEPYGLCPRISVAWTGFCLAGDFVGEGREVQLEGWVAVDGEIEIHFTQGGSLVSAARLATFNIREIRSSPLQLEFVESITSIEDVFAAVERGQEVLKITPLPGDIGSEPGLPPEAELVEPPGE